MKNISINYQELAFITEIPLNTAKAMFEEMLSEKPKTDSLIPVHQLMPNFGVIKSVDERYDGINILLFSMEHKAKNYLKYVNNKLVIKKKGFIGGQKIFYKIMSNEQKAHFEKVINYKYNYLYKK